MVISASSLRGEGGAGTLQGAVRRGLADPQHVRGLGRRVAEYVPHHQIAAGLALAGCLAGLALPGPRADVADVPRGVVLSRRRVTMRGRPG
jgi:hypothetical protein